jgi:hypothetical protein
MRDLHNVWLHVSQASQDPAHGLLISSHNVVRRLTSDGPVATRSGAQSSPQSSAMQCCGRRWPCCRHALQQRAATTSACTPMRRPWSCCTSCGQRWTFIQMVPLLPVLGYVDIRALYTNRIQWARDDLKACCGGSHAACPQLDCPLMLPLVTPCRHAVCGALHQRTVQAVCCRAADAAAALHSLLAKRR